MFDTLVIGAGPAGSVAALTLARAGQRVALLERGRSDEPRVGESVPPLIRELLTRLELWDDFRAQGHRPAYELRSIWNGTVRERNTVFNRFGSGFHLDRRGFDAWLLGHAESAGVLRYEPAQIRNIDALPSGYRVTYEIAGAVQILDTRFLIDATGARAWLGRRVGAERLRGQRLVGVARWFRHDSEPVTLVESAPDGYWYSAPLPGGAFVAVWMTDSESPSLRAGQSDALWSECLASAPATAERLRGAQPLGEPLVRTSGPAVTRWPRGVRFLPVGDAAVGFDPLSGYGLCFALRSGFEAAHAVEAAISGRYEAAEQYRGAVEAVFGRHLRSRQAAYAAERRFAAYPFWQRARAEPSLV